MNETTTPTELLRPMFCQECSGPISRPEQVTVVLATSVDGERNWLSNRTKCCTGNLSLRPPSKAKEPA